MRATEQEGDPRGENTAAGQRARASREGEERSKQYCGLEENRKDRKRKRQGNSQGERKKVSEKEHEGGKTDREEERWRKTGRFDNGGNVFGRPGAAFLRSVAALISVVPPALSCQVPLTHNPSAEPGVVTGA